MHIFYNPDHAAHQGKLEMYRGRMVPCHEVPQRQDQVLAALQARLGLSADDVQRSTVLLREIGNVSSPFVFFVLERALAEHAPGGWWWMSSFGAGFSAHGALLQVD